MEIDRYNDQRIYIRPISEKDAIEKADLPPKIVYEIDKDSDTLSLESAIQKHIMGVLEIAEGNKKKAADLLGIDRSTLYAKLRSYEEKEGE